MKKDKIEIVRMETSNKICYICDGKGSHKKESICSICGGTGTFKDNHYILMVNGMAWFMDTIK